MSTSTKHTKRRAPDGVVKTRPIGLDLPEEHLKKVRQLAEQEHRSAAAMARLLVLVGLSKYRSPRTSRRASAAAPADRSGVVIGLRLLPDELDTIKAIATAEQRPLANLARLLAVNGLSDYEQRSARCCS